MDIVMLVWASLLTVALIAGYFYLGHKINDVYFEVECLRAQLNPLTKGAVPIHLTRKRNIKTPLQPAPKKIDFSQLEVLDDLSPD